MNNKKMLLFPYTLWMIIFIIIPIFIVLYYGLTNRDGNFTISNIFAIFSPVNFKAFKISLNLAIVSTFFCLFLAYPLCMILVSKNIKSNNFFIMLFILPMWMNFLLRTLAWQTILERNGVLNAILGFLSLPKVYIMNTKYAIILGMIYNFLPFMILPIYNSLVKIDKELINASKDLGANDVQTFFRIILPLTFPGVLSGIIMVFVPALTTFAISDILGGGKIQLIGNIIDKEFTLASNWHVGSGLSIVLMIFVVFSMALITKYEKEEEIK